MTFIYTQADFQSGINRRIQGKQDILIDIQETMNEAVRLVLNEVRITSTRRKYPLVPNLMKGAFEYVVPIDLHSNDIIDIPASALRLDGEFTLVPSEQFARNPKLGDIALNDYNGIRSLSIFSATTDNSLTIDPAAVVTPSEWRAFGDATNIDSTTDDSVKGDTSIVFDINASGGTTAGVYNDSVASIDLTDYINHPANVFSYARITSATGITNYKLRLGSSASAYYEFTVVARSDGSVFTTGWNPLRFDLSTPTTVGSPDVTAITYAALFMTKAASKVSENSYMFNLLEARRGKYADILYYSKYGWQSSAGIYKENSTDPSDLLVADTDEFDLFVKMGRVLAAAEADVPVSIYRGHINNPLANEYEAAKANYVLNNPSEDKTVISSYYNYG